MPSSGKPKCLIAAGGTAGHVLPALAVAESLSRLGAEVTLASNTDSRLVRDAGYELDVFGVEGFPREVSVRLAKALGRAATAVPACVRILRRRRPDVVLGGGGYVAGPMVLAAGSMRIPAALSEADAHLGLANRLAAPFAKVVFLAYPVEEHEPPKYQVVGRPIPARSLRPTSLLPAPAARSGRSPRPVGRRCSSRTRMQPPITRPRTPATSSAVEAPSSCRSRSSTCAGMSRSFWQIRSACRGWVRQ